MIKFKDKTIFITGASAGIGKSIAIAFAQEGARLILSARRKERIENLAMELKEKFDAEILTLHLDVSKRETVKNAIEGLPEEWKSIDILINNAGLGRGLNKLYEDNIDGWEEMIDTNIKGLLYVSRLIIPGMVERKSGHVINIGSIAGHEAYGGGAVYCATKHAVKAITRSLRIDLLGTGVRVSSVDPGMVETEFSIVRFYGNEEKAKNVYKGLTPLSAEDIAEAVIFVASRPPHVNINEMIIMPTAQANAFISYREE